VVFDTPPQPLERYVRRHTRSTHAPWRFNHKVSEMERGRTLRVETLAPAVVHWSSDSWRTVLDSPTRDTGLGLHVVDLPTGELGEGACVDFTFFWPGAGRWEGRDFSVTTAAASP
jgi:glucoamylase